MANQKRTQGRRNFLRVLGTATLTAATGTTHINAGNREPPQPRLDPKAPLRIGMIGRTGHLGYVLDKLSSVKGAVISAYAFEDAEWDYNSDGTHRRGAYDMTPQREWVEANPWASSKPRLYETYQEMLKSEQLDVAVVCLPYARNAFAITAAAEAGLHILTEKPVAVNYDDLRMVEQAIKRNSVRLTAMFAMRYSPSIYTVRQAVKRGQLGLLCLARAQKSYKWGQNRPWFYRHPEIYGSTILWVGIHAIDYLRWCTGLEVTKVAGFHSNLAHPDFPAAQDNVVTIMELDGGATASITMDFLRPERAPTHGDDRIRIAGSKGIAETFLQDGRVKLLSKAKDPIDLELEKPPLELFPDFVSELRGLGNHLIGPDEAVRITQICIAATEAAERENVLEV